MVAKHNPSYSRTEMALWFLFTCVSVVGIAKHYAFLNKKNFLWMLHISQNFNILIKKGLSIAWPHLLKVHVNFLHLWKILGPISSPSPVIKPISSPVQMVDTISYILGFFFNILIFESYFPCFITEH